MIRLKEKHVMCAEVLRERGWSVRTIARELGFDESTLRYHLRKKQRKQAVAGRKDKLELCAAWAAPIGAWMQSQSGLLRQEGIRSLYEQLVREEGYTGSYNAVRRYVRRRMGTPRCRPRRRVETAPGAQAQADWAEHKVYLHDHGEVVKIYSFVLSLSYSRMYAVIWSLPMDQAAGCGEN